MKCWDVVVVGGGIIGLSLALALKRHGAQVLLVERSQPGREASHAAAGMLVAAGDEMPAVLRPLGMASARLYPEFVHLLEDESAMHVDLRSDGVILAAGNEPPPGAAQPLTAEQAAKIEPALAVSQPLYFLEEQSVDPRALLAASLKAAKHVGLEIASGTPVTEVIVQSGRAAGVCTPKTEFHSAVVVNCAGAWSGQIAPLPFPTRPIKGQMLALVARKNLLRHVIRARDVYLVPRTDGRILAGSTLEDAGFDKRVDAGTIQRLHQAAANLVPELGQARMLEDWAGLRPATPDHLLILGRTPVDGYFVATGHYRDGILLAPITALVMSRLLRDEDPGFDLAPFSPARFHA